MTIGYWYSVVGAYPGVAGVRGVDSSGVGIFAEDLGRVSIVERVWGPMVG